MLINSWSTLPFQLTAQLILSSIVLCEVFPAAIHLDIGTPRGLRTDFDPQKSSVNVTRILPSSPPPTSVSSLPVPTTPPPENTTATPPTPPTPEHVPTTGMVAVVLHGIRELDNKSNEVGFKTNETIGQHHFDGPFFVSVNPAGSPAAVNLSSSVLAVCQTVRGDIGNSSSIAARVCAVNSNGTLLDQTMSVSEGQLVVTITVIGWNWCGCEGGVVGSYLEMNLTVAVPDDRKVTKSNDSSGRPIKLSLGTVDSYALFSGVVNGGAAVLSELVQTSPEGPTATLVLRLPRPSHGNSIQFDAVVEPGYQQQPPDHVSSAPRMFQSITSAATLLAVYAVNQLL